MSPLTSTGSDDLASACQAKCPRARIARGGASFGADAASATPVSLQAILTVIPITNRARASAVLRALAAAASVYEAMATTRSCSVQCQGDQRFAEAGE